MTRQIVQTLVISVVVLAPILATSLCGQTTRSDDPVEGLIIQSLRDSDERSRSRAIYRLRDVRPTTDEIILALGQVVDKDASATVRGTAVHVIGGIVKSDAQVAIVLPVLLARVRDAKEQPRLRETIVTMLAKIAPGDAGVRHALGQLVQAQQETVGIRVRAADGLGSMSVGGNEDLQGLRRLARTEESDDVRVALWGAIVDLLPGDEEAVDVLISLAQSRRDLPATLRSKAIRILGDARLARIIPIWVEALDDEHPQVRAFAAIALGHYGSQAKTAIPSLIEFFRNTPAQGDGSSLRALTLVALAEIDPASPVVLELIQTMADSDPNEQLRDYAMRILARIGRD